MNTRTNSGHKFPTPALIAWVAFGCPNVGPLWNSAAWEQSAKDHGHGGDVTSDLLRAMQVVTAALGLPAPRRYDAQAHAANVRTLVQRLKAAEAA